MTDTDHPWLSGDGPTGDGDADLAATATFDRLDGVAAVPGVPGGDGRRVLRPVRDGGAGGVVPWAGSEVPRAAAHDTPAPLPPHVTHRRLWRVRVTDPAGRTVYTPPVTYVGEWPGWQVETAYGWDVGIEVSSEVVERNPWREVGPAGVPIVGP
jgi:hypothetical protein